MKTRLFIVRARLYIVTMGLFIVSPAVVVASSGVVIASVGRPGVATLTAPACMASRVACRLLSCTPNGPNNRNGGPMSNPRGTLSNLAKLDRTLVE